MPIRNKAVEALPAIIGGIISWILNRAKDVVGWVSQNLWALAVGIGRLIYLSSNSNCTQCYESQLSVMLFISWGVEIAQRRFSR